MILLLTYIYFYFLFTYFLIAQEEGYPVTELLNHTPFSKGWQSSRFADFPQEITFSFPSYVKVKKLEVLSHQYKISSKIEIHILNPKNSKKYKKIGYLCLDSNERSNFQARELKSVNIDYECLAVKIVLHRPYVNQLNNFVQVGLIAFNAMGFPTVENPLENPPVFRNKDYDNLEDQMLYDPITYKRLKALGKAKQRAIELEDFQEAQKIKEAIDRLKAVSSQLIQLEERKQIAIQNDDFEAAKIIKYEVERLRNAVAGINVDMQGFDPESVMPSYNNMMNNQLKKNQDNNYNNYNNDDNMDENTLMRRQKQFKSNIHQDKGLEEYPVNSEMFMNPSNFTDKARNINQGKRVIINPQDFTGMDVEDRPIKGTTQPFNVQVSQDIRNMKEREKPSSAYNNNNNLNNIQENNYNNDNNYDEDEVGDDIPSNVYKYAEPLIPYLSHDLLKLIFSTEWKKKDKGLQILMDEIKAHPHSKLLSAHDQDKIITAIMGAVAHCLTSIVNNVILSSLEVIKILLNKFHSTQIKGYYRGDLNSYTDNTLILILEKIGESNIKMKERAENTVLEMANSPLIGSKIVFEHLISGQIKKTLVNSARHLTSRLNLISRMIDSFGLNKDEVGIQALMILAFSGFKNPNKDVRNAAYNLIMSCYKFLGNEVKSYYNDLRQPQRELLEEGFDKIDSETVGQKYGDNNDIMGRIESESPKKTNKGNMNKNNRNDNFDNEEQQINNKNSNNYNNNDGGNFSNQYGYEEGKHYVNVLLSSIIIYFTIFSIHNF